jgi:transposase
LNDRTLGIRRAKGLQMLRAGISQADVARRLGVTRATVHVWSLRISLAEMAPPLLRRGPTPGMADSECRRLRRMLRELPITRGKPPTLEAIRQLIMTEFGLSYSRSQISRIAKGTGWDIRRGRLMEPLEGAFNAGWERDKRSRLTKLSLLRERSGTGPQHATEQCVPALLHEPDRPDHDVSRAASPTAAAPGTVLPGVS